MRIGHSCAAVTHHKPPSRGKRVKEPIGQQAGEGGGEDAGEKPAVNAKSEDPPLGAHASDVELLRASVAKSSSQK